jgi:hypothetical protein
VSAYSTALRALSERLDSDLALLRQREHTEALSVVEAATERCRILQRHLDACRELRRQHLQGFTDLYEGHQGPLPGAVQNGPSALAPARSAEGGHVAGGPVAERSRWPAGELVDGGLDAGAGAGVRSGKGCRRAGAARFRPLVRRPGGRAAGRRPARW